MIDLLRLIESGGDRDLPATIIDSLEEIWGDRDGDLAERTSMEFNIPISLGILGMILPEVLRCDVPFGFPIRGRGCVR